MENAARDQWNASLEVELRARRQKNLYRELRRAESGSAPEMMIDGRRYLQFAMNNYLGLADHPALIEAARVATEKYGTGAGASRLVAGSLAIHHELEEALARFKGTEAALLFSTGFMANLAVLTTFAGNGDVVVSDKLNHASLLDAAAYCGAHHRTFPHRHYDRAKELLERPREGAGKRFLVTDAVFSMDGDVAHLRAAADIADATGAILIVDDAHGTGVLGERGAGTAEAQGVEDRITLTAGTLSKALGAVGGFVAGPRAAIEMLINSARSFIYTTALPAACAGAALAALQIVEREPERRRRVLALAAHVRREFIGMGYNVGDSVTPIIPVILGDSEKAVEASAHLREMGIYIPPIRPPTVAPGAARLRISLMATHSDAHIQQLLDAMRGIR